jgi:hypothetical protein
MQSFELGAGPTALLAAAIPHIMLAKSNGNIAIPTFFLHFFASRNYANGLI